MEFSENTDIEEYLMLGTSSLDYIVYEKATGKYQILSNDSMEVMGKFDDFLSMLEAFFNPTYDDDDE